MLKSISWLQSNIMRQSPKQKIKSGTKLYLFLLGLLLSDAFSSNRRLEREWDAAVLRSMSFSLVFPIAVCPDGTSEPKTTNLFLFPFLSLRKSACHFPSLGTVTELTKHSWVSSQLFAWKDLVHTLCQNMTCGIWTEDSVCVPPSRFGQMKEVQGSQLRSFWMIESVVYISRGFQGCLSHCCRRASFSRRKTALTFAWCGFCSCLGFPMALN